MAEIVGEIVARLVVEAVAFTIGAAIQSGVDAKKQKERKARQLLNSVQFPTRERPEWVPDGSSKSCLRCQQTFGAYYRRHHCRSCGLLLCAKCIHPLLIQLPELSYHAPVKVCMECLASRQAAIKTSLAAQIEDNTENPDRDTAEMYVDKTLESLLNGKEDEYAPPEDPIPFHSVSQDFDSAEGEEHISLSESFAECIATITTSRALLDKKDQLSLYAYHEQATRGPCTSHRPNYNVAERTLHDAWSALGDMSREDAMQAYIDVVLHIVASSEQPPPYSDKDEVAPNIVYQQGDGWPSIVYQPPLVEITQPPLGEEELPSLFQQQPPQLQGPQPSAPPEMQDFIPVQYGTVNLPGTPTHIPELSNVDDQAEKPPEDTKKKVIAL